MHHNGQPVWIWVHGWGMSPDIWEEAVNGLPGARHRRFSYRDCATVDQMRECLRRTIAEECGPVGLIGWSLGGMLALDAALEQWESRTAEEERLADAENGTGATAEKKAPVGTSAADGRSSGSEAAALGPIARVALVGATLRFVGDDRTKAWPARVVRRMRSQLAGQPDETRRRFAESMLSAAERDGRPELPQWLARLGAPTDFSQPGLDAGLAYLLETNLTERWRRFAEATVVREAVDRPQGAGGDADADTAVSDARCTAGASVPVAAVPGASGTAGATVPGAIDRPAAGGGAARSGAALAAAVAPDIVWMHGEDDPICPLGALADVPAERRIVFAGAGHAPFLTQPRRFAEQLGRWADGHR